MRIQIVALLFTIHFIIHGECWPNTIDYPGDEDYGDDNNDAENIPETNSPPAHILTNSLKFLVRSGENVHLPCNVSNTNDVAVLWKKGQIILYSDNVPYINDVQKITRQNDNSLIINNFNNNDVSDEYICEITSVPPEQITHSVRMKALYPHPSEYVKINEANKKITLKCQANWEPKPMIKWFYKSQRLQSDNYPEDGSSLTIYNVSESNAGLYQCLAESSDGGQPDIRAIHVVVHHVPKIEVENDVVHTGMLMDTELTCKVAAYPPAEITWLKNNKKVTDGKQNKMDSPNREEAKYTLALTRVEESDFGEYTCLAANKIGQASRTIILTGSPREAKFVGIVDTIKDGTVPVLEWEVVSYSPIIEYELKYRSKGEKDWKIVNPRASDDGTGNIFKIKYPIEGLKDDQYETVLTSKNRFGWSPRPGKIETFKGEYITAEPDTAGSKSGASSTRSEILLRSTLLTFCSILVFITYH